MEKKIVTFKGITNVPDDGLNEAGDMAVLMNMRHKGGELVPCGKPTPVAVGEELKQVLYHANSGYWLGLNSRGDLYSYDDNMNPCGDDIAEGVESFALMGNIVIMNFADRVEYAIWRNGDFEYLGGLPEVPEMGITLEHHTENVETESYYNYSTMKSDGGQTEKWMTASKGYFDKCLSLHYNNARFVDNALFVVGLRLFDGTYKYSHLYLIRDEYKETLKSINVGEHEISSGKGNFITIARKRPSNYSGGTSARMNVNILGFTPVFSMNADLKNWDDIIVGIDVFTSGSIMEHKASLLPMNLYDGTNSEIGEDHYKVSTDRDVEVYASLTIPELRGKIEQTSSFYRYAQFDVYGKMINVVENTSPSNLAVQENLTLSNVRDYVAKGKMVINGRLHIFDYWEQHMFPEQNMLNKGGAKSGKSGNMKMSVLLENGDVLEKQYSYIDNFPTSETLTSLLTFPERGVKKAQYSWIEDKKNKYIEAEFKEHPFFDYSFSLHGNKKSEYYIECEIAGQMYNMYDENGETPFMYLNVNHELVCSLFGGNHRELNFVRQSVTSSGSNVWGWRLNNSKTFYPDDSANWIETNYKGHTPGTLVRIRLLKKETFFDISPIEIVETVKEVLAGEELKTPKRNTLKVSAVDNPFYFPTAQTYKFEGDIKGLASNAEAISTGQFGQYPLFVFTDTGIWAMSVDTSGQGAYTTQSPFSREVCNGAICPVSGGVVFSTDKGVMVISGGQVADLSAALDGFEEDFFGYNGGMWTKVFEKAGKDAVVNPVPIREYIKGAVIAYNYHYNEIIVSNKAFKYSYVYSLTNKVWSIIDTVFDLTTNKYPELVVFDKDGAMYTFEDGDAQNKVVAITRPFTMGSLDFKRIRQAGLRTTYEGELNFYVLGSVDGAEFKCITGKEHDSGDNTSGIQRDLITAMSRSKQYKYFVIAVVGNIKGRVSMAELLVDMGFANNQIR